LERDFRDESRTEGAASEWPGWSLYSLPSETEKPYPEETDHRLSHFPAIIIEHQTLGNL
jgi:hypothetical protein